MSRPAPATRRRCEWILADEGWTTVKVLKPIVNPEPTYYDMLIWCEETLGNGRVEPSQLDGEDVWYSFTWYGFFRFYFKHSKDATAFTLRWL